jgi:pyruvate formate lyase activating enzyme
MLQPNSPNPNGIIFNVQRFSIHDGPGIRTTVFLKGCNLRCQWCHNPESIQKGPEVQFFPEKCMLCGSCSAICPEGAQLQDGNQRIYLRDRCVACGKCVEDCFSDALVMSGAERSVESVLAEIRRDEEYFRTSGGGVTLSGGEPLLQPDFVYSLLQECQRAGLNCAVDTAGNVPWKTIARIAPLADLFLYDVKAFHASIHRTATGVSNRLILENLKRLDGLGKRIWVRIPVVPGINDAPAEILEIARFLQPLKSVEWVELLPFHSLGAEKYESLGRDYRAGGIPIPRVADLDPLLELFENHQIHARSMK